MSNSAKSTQSTKPTSLAATVEAAVKQQAQAQLNLESELAQAQVFSEQAPDTAGRDAAELAALGGTKLNGVGSLVAPEAAPAGTVTKNAQAPAAASATPDKPRMVRAAQATLPTEYGLFDIIVYEETATGKEHVAMVHGDVKGKEDVVSRIHSECLTGDIFHSLKCDCGFQLAYAMQSVVDAGAGVVIYHRAEGRGIGLTNKIRAYALQDQGMDTVEANNALGFPADLRDFSICADIYQDLGVKSVSLLTNNPRKVQMMLKAGINVTSRRPVVVGKNKYNQKYLEVKSAKLAHLISEEQLAQDNDFEPGFGKED